MQRLEKPGDLFRLRLVASREICSDLIRRHRALFRGEGAFRAYGRRSKQQRAFLLRPVRQNFDLQACVISVQDYSSNAKIATANGDLPYDCALLS